MGCLPYFKFYAGDWLSDATVRRMTPEARGLYFDLLCVSWQECGVPTDPSELAGWLGWTPKRFAKAWEQIESLWVHGAEGKLVNPRQEKERQGAHEAHERRVAAGRKGGQAK